jgi:N,N'-diacetyllegionaminate synthase
MTTKIIAEFCQNHNGSFEILQRMIGAAAESGATHGKIQTIFAGDLAFRPEFEEGAIDDAGVTQTIKRPYQAEYDRLKKLELSYSEHTAFIEECRRAGLEPLTTAFNITTIPELSQIGFRSIKIASYDCGAVPLIRAVALAFDELIISTGATLDDEIAKTAECLQQMGKPFTFLHCVTIYPTPLDAIHLRRMEFLRQFTPHVGLSDHTLVARDGVKAAMAAIYEGAEVIERHFTILPAGETRDGAVSITAAHLAELAAFAKLSRSEQEAYLKEHVPEHGSMLGTSKRALSPTELLNRAYYRGRFCNKVDGRQIFNWEWAAS